MAKLYYKYGSMGSSKTANALMTKFNYEEKGKRVLLLKPSIDNRDGESLLVAHIFFTPKFIVPSAFLSNTVPTAFASFTQPLRFGTCS